MRCIDGHLADRILAVLCGVADVVCGGAVICGNRRRSASTISAVSSVASVVCVRYATGRRGSGASSSPVDVVRLPPRLETGPAPHQGPDDLLVIAWPMEDECSPDSRSDAASLCTLATSGQVASHTLRSLRSAACSRTSGDTPCAANTTTRVQRHFVDLLHEHGTLGSRSRTTCRLWTDLTADVDRRSVALKCALDDLDRGSTPAQKDGVRRAPPHAHRRRVAQRSSGRRTASSDPSARAPTEPPAPRSVVSEIERMTQAGCWADSP